ncbi:MAG: hypothetical protein K0S33_2561 [Bacteroidetes bacterium]|nr:hypothetical protein [Bacteroidota bacterium]
MRIRSFVISVISVAIGILFSTCKKDPVLENPPDLGYDYFPVHVGKYIVYNVDSTKYRAIEADTIHLLYRIKEQIDSVFNDNQGRETFKLVRYVKYYSPTVSYDSMPWTIKDVWAVNLTKTTAEVVEENVRFIKLSFPVMMNTTWNGNSQNTMVQWDYKYTAMNGQEMINTRNYENILTVTQKDYSTALGRQFYEEKFSKGIGMISKEIRDYVFKVENGVLQPGVISEGVIYKMSIVDYHL